jgi:hypothetical protein
LLPRAFRPARIRLLTAVLATALAAALLPASPATAETGQGGIAVAFAWSDINGSGYRTTQAYTSRSVRARFAFQKWWWSSASSTAPVVGMVQRRIGTGAWRSTGQSVVTRSTVFDVRIRPYSLKATAKGATVRYRIAVPTGGTVREGDVSSAVKVVYKNVHRYTGFALALYRAVRQYCPAAVIRVMRLPAGEAGEQPFGLYEIRIAPAVRTYRPAYARSVALHECGHFLQWKNYGSSNEGYRTMLRQANRIYGTNHNYPMEHMADCIARAVEPNGYLGYGGRCTAKQIRYAWRVLKGGRLY